MRNSASVPQLVGIQRPRLETPETGLPTRGPDLIDFAAAYSQPLLSWQEYFVNRAMEYDPKTGRWAHRICGLSIARQNGKTHVMAMRILTGLYLWDEDSWITMAQSRDMAKQTFDWAADIIEHNPELARRTTIRRANGQESIEVKGGGKWVIVAATPEGPRGRSGNLFVDELRHISPEVWGAAAPVTRKPSRQILVASNAGDPDSTVLHDLRNAALAGLDPRIGWWEWSADPALAPDDRLAWAQANPSLGGLIDEAALATSYATDPPAVFRTEALCLPVDHALASPWPPEAWADCLDENLKLAPGRPTWLAIDQAPDRQTATLVGGQLLEDGRIAVGLLESWEADGALNDLAIAGTIATWARKYHVQLVSFDRYTSSAIAARLAAAGIPVADVSRATFYQACDELLTAMNGKRLAHAGQPELTAHVQSCARKSDPSGGWRIIPAAKHPITAAVGLAMVVHQASQPQKTAGIMVV